MEIVLKRTTWAVDAAAVIQSNIEKVLGEKDVCNVMLTGGRSASLLYNAWSQNPHFERTKGIRFFFGDERCVPPDHSESNYGMVMRALFSRGVPSGCEIFRIRAEKPDPYSAAKDYAELLPDRIDFLLLGIGEDGHIASLFPFGDGLNEFNQKVIAVTGPKPPFSRITITPAVIKTAKSIFVLARGAQKKDIFKKAMQAPHEVQNIPARYVLRASWLFDDDR